MNLIRSSFELINRVYYLVPAILVCSIFVVIGVIISMMIDKYLPDNNTYDDKGLYRVGIISMLAIMVHNILKIVSIMHHR